VAHSIAPELGLSYQLWRRSSRLLPFALWSLVLPFSALSTDTLLASC
jgi:hypothetical protein